MLPKTARLWALLCLALIVAVSQSFDVVKRDDNPTPTTIPTSSSSAPKGTNSARIDNDGKDPKERGGESLSSTLSGTITDAPTSTHRPTSTLPLTIATDGPLDNTTFFNGMRIRVVGLDSSPLKADSSNQQRYLMVSYHCHPDSLPAGESQESLCS